ALVVREGADLQHDGDPDPLLLRLPGQRWSGRGRGRGRPCGTGLDRGDQRRRLLHEPGHLGRDDDGPGGRMSKARLRLVGVAFLAVIGLLIWLSLALYNKQFTPVATVTLHTGSVGNEMHPGGQVLVRGVQVGEVRSISADGGGAVL